AEAQPVVVLRVEGACPERATAARLLEPTIPEVILDEGAVDASVARIAIVDRGDEFEARVGAEHRDFPDAGRDCEERARAAAVGIALAVPPPRLGTVGPASFRVPSASASASVAPGVRRVELAAFGIADVAPVGGGVWTGGGGVRLVVGGERFSGSLGVAALS